MASAVSMHLRETKGDGIEDNTHTHKAARIGPSNQTAIKVLKLKTKKEKEVVFIFIVLSFF